MTEMMPEVIESKDKIYTALSKAQDELPFTIKNRKANYGKFADKFMMMQHVWCVLKKYGLSINEAIRVLPNGKECLRVTLMHESGQSIMSETIISDIQLTKENPDHTWAKSVTYRSRTLYRGLLGIAIPNDATDIDDIQQESELIPTINIIQQSELISLCNNKVEVIEAICKKYGIDSLHLLSTDDYDNVVKWVENKRNEKTKI